MVALFGLGDTLIETNALAHTQHGGGLKTTARHSNRPFGAPSAGHLRTTPTCTFRNRLSTIRDRPKVTQTKTRRKKKHNTNATVATRTHHMREIVCGWWFLLTLCTNNAPSVADPDTSTDRCSCSRHSTAPLSALWCCCCSPMSSSSLSSRSAIVWRQTMCRAPL